MRTAGISMIAAVCILSIFGSCAWSQTPGENLKPLAPLVGKTWEGYLKAPDGSGESKVVRTFEPIWEGKVIRCEKENTALGNRGEGYFYWDDIEKKIAFFFIESGGTFLKGYASADGSAITIEGTMTWPRKLNPDVKQSYDFRDVFEFTGDGRMTDKWYQNAFGSWRPGHVIEFNAVDQ